MNSGEPPRPPTRTLIPEGAAVPVADSVLPPLPPLPPPPPLLGLSAPSSSQVPTMEASPWEAEPAASPRVPPPKLPLDAVPPAPPSPFAGSSAFQADDAAVSVVRPVRVGTSVAPPAPEAESTVVSRPPPSPPTPRVPPPSAASVAARESAPEVEPEVDVAAHLPAPPSRPPPPPPRRPSTAPPASSKAPAPPREAVPWWEELFGEAFVPTHDRLSGPQVRKEVAFLEQALGLSAGSSVLDLGCGAGQHAVELASRGYRVVAIDSSTTMLSQAARAAQGREPRPLFVKQDLREFAYEAEFDALYCWSTTFGYFDDAKNADLLRRSHRALKAGGTLLLDVANRDYLAARSPSLVWFEGRGCICMDDMHFDALTSRLRVKRTAMFEGGPTRELDYSVRLYALHELAKLLQDLGFTLKEVSGHLAHRGAYFGSDSPRMIVVAAKR